MPPTDQKPLGTRDLAHLGWANVRHSKRTARTFVSIAVATYLLLISFASINAMASMMEESAREVISGDASAFNDDYEYSMLSAESDAVYYIGSSDDVMESLEAVEGVENVRPRLNASLQLESETQREGGLLSGTDFEREPYELLEGTLPVNSGEICLNPSLAESLGAGVGERLDLIIAGAPSENLSLQATVTCIYDNGSFGLFRTSHVLMPIDVLRDILDRPGASTQLMVDFADGASAGNLMDGLRDVIPENVQLKPASETADLIFTIQAAQQSVMWVLVIITALICAIIIGDIIGFALHRQRHEVATMRAMGFRPAQLRVVYLTQTLSIGLIMVGIGVIAALITTWVIAAIGIPIGEGRQLFGGSELVPFLTWQNILFTALLMLGSLALASVSATNRLVERTPVELLTAR